FIDKEVDIGRPLTEQDRYKVLNFRYIYSKPNIIKRLQYAVNFELGNNFTKLSTDIKLQKFFDIQRSFDVRFFSGLFITNNSFGSYFSFRLNRSSDYLFEQNLFGRSESLGFFSQQYVISDAGFKSKYSSPQTADQFVFAINTSVSLWRWFELYNDFAVLKSKNNHPNYYYENGFRLNFIPRIFEFYFPIYNNESFELIKKAYPTKIRFIITTSLDRIYNFIRRGIL
ncbi:MAG: aminopeptidase, partial [Tenacibaculum sp.]